MREKGTKTMAVTPVKFISRSMVAVATVLLLVAGLTVTSSLTSRQSASGAQVPIKIGLVCGCTGPLAAAVVDVPAIYKAWVSSVNAAGGINGHKIVLISKNDDSNPTTSTTIVHEFVQTDHVIAIVDASNNDAVWATYVQQQGVPVVGMDTSAEPYFDNPDFYPEGQTEDSLFSGIIKAVKQASATKFALFYCAEAVQCQEGIAPLQAAAKGAGLSVVTTQQVSASAPNYTAQCLAAQQAGATVIFTADAQTVDEKIIQDCYTQGYKPKVVIDGEILLPSLATTPAINQATYFTVPNLPYFANTPAIKAMNTALKKYAPTVLKDVNYGELPMETWVAGKMFQAAAVAGNLGAHGAPTSAQLTKGLNSLHGATLGGLAPPLNFTAGQPHPVDCWYYALLKDGKYSTPFGLKPVCSTSS
jgi:branched-chain amino acid transport system substrate-binding protein